MNETPKGVRSTGRKGRKWPWLSRRGLPEKIERPLTSVVREEVESKFRFCYK